MKIGHWFILLALALGLSAQGHAKHYHTKKYEKKHHKGLNRDLHAKKFLEETPRLHVPRGVQLPSSADLSSEVSLPEDQGQCGQCWAYSLTKALRSEYMIAGVDPGVLEFLYLVNNCGPGPSMGGCRGGDFVAAQNFLNSYGPGLNALNPDVGRDGGQCLNQPVKATAVDYQMVGGSSGPTFYDLAYLVGGAEKHMVSIDVAAGSGDWESYSDGIYDGCTGGPNQIDHMIDLVGYDCETSVDGQGHCVFNAQGYPVNGDGYLIDENNWGEEWGTKAGNGHGGYQKTRMLVNGKKCNAIATDALVFKINAQPHPPVPPPVPPTPPVPPAPACNGFLCHTLGCWLPWCS